MWRKRSLLNNMLAWLHDLALWPHSWHLFYLEVSRSTFEIALPHEWQGWLTWLWVVHSWPWHWHVCAHTGVGGCTGLWPGDFRRRRAIYIPSLVYKTVVDLPIKYSCDPHRTRICTKLVKISILYICTRLAGILLCSWGVVSHHKYSRL